MDGQLPAQDVNGLLASGLDWYRGAEEKANMRTIHATILTALVAFLCVGVQGESQTGLEVAADGFPTGHTTPEGGACDLARAFIERSPTLLGSTCIRPYGPAAYPEFLESVIESMREEAAKETPSPAGPKAIAKVFAARHLSLNGPSSYGYAAFGFQDIMFVDVGVILHSGSRSVNRTLVIRDRDGKWYAHPAPSVSPLLSAGLNDETPSEKDFAEVYDVSE